MKLKTLTARAFKGLTFTLDLQAINFLVGSNFAGKTARTDAIRFLLLGYLPELGKTAQATFGLASGREMVVEGTFDNGLTIRRVRRLEGDSVKTDDTIPEEIEKCGQLAVMLNAETYFALSPRERVNYVFANVQMGPEWSSHEILDRVNTTLTELPRSPTHGTIITHLVGLRDTPGLAPQAFVEESLAWLTIEAKSAKDYAAKMEKTTQGLAALKTQDQDAIVAGIATIDSDRETLMVEIQTHTTKKAEHQVAYNAMVAARKRRGIIESQPRALPGFKQTLETLKYRIGQKQTALADIPEVNDADIEEARQTENSHATAKRDAEHDLRTMENTLAQNNAELAAIESKTVCPYCGASGDGWKVLRIAELKGAIAGITSKIKLLNEQIDVAGNEHARAYAKREKLVKAKQERTAIERETNTIKDEIHKVEKQIATLEAFAEELARLPAEDPAVLQAVESAQTALNVANEGLRSLDNQRKTALARQQDQKRLAEAEQERDKAKADLALYVAAGKRLREIQGEMVKAAFTPLLRAANNFFPNILKTPIAYNDGEIGTWRDGIWVTHRTLSGTEKALTYAAIQAALAASSPVRIMILDELGRLDTKNMLELVRSALICCRDQKLVDQLIGIDATNRLTGTFEDCQVITIS